MKLQTITGKLTELAWEHGVEVVFQPQAARRTPSTLLVPAQLYPGTSVAAVRRLLPDLQLAFNRVARTDELALRFDSRTAVLAIPRRQVETLELTPDHWRRLTPHRCVLGCAYSMFGDKLIGLDLQQEHNAHVLIGGTTGSGKTTLLRAALATLLYSTSPADLRVFLVDLKHSGLSPFAVLPHVAAYASDADAAAAVFAEAFRTFESRLEARHTPSTPRILLVVDEYAELMEYDTTGAINRYARTLGRMGREFAINLWLATQKPTMDVIDSQLRDQLNTRFIGKVESAQLSQYLTGRSDTQAHMLPVGRGEFIAIRPATEPKVINGFKMTESITDHLLHAILARWQSAPAQPKLTMAAAQVTQPAVLQDARKIAPVLRQYWQSGKMLNGGWSRCAEAIGVTYAGGHVGHVRNAVESAISMISEGDYDE